MKVLRMATAFFYCCNFIVMFPFITSNQPVFSAYEQLRDSILDFSISGFNILDHDNEQKGNILYSPFSVYSVLMLTHLGAKGKTAQQICKTLKLCHMNITMVHEAFGQINKDIILTDALETANGLFIQRGFSVSSSYEHALKHFYSTQLTEVDFRNALIEINSWVQQHTRGKISAVLDKNPSHATKMMMVNAAYFRSRWKWEFDPRATEPSGYFYLTPRRRVQVPIMSGKMNVAIGHDISVGASILELPFTPSRVSMFLVLPDNPELHFHFNVTSMKLLIGSMKKRDVNVRLPRFSLDQIPQMTDLLWNLGIQDIFSPTEADLGGIAKGLFVTDVMQRSVLKVDEEGSIASAATVTLVERIGNVDDHYFEANRPFIFMVMDKKTGAVLFMGRVANF